MSNARAARRRAEKEAAKQEPSPEAPASRPHAGTQQIRLENPVQEFFASFIVGNAAQCDHVVEENSAKGQHLVLCGAGPTLRDHAAEYCPTADQVWGCNSAAIWLYENGHKVTHAFTVDQTAMMCQEWVSAPPVEYIVASTVHPHLVEYLLSKGRTLRFCHNYVGLERTRRPVRWADGNGKMRTESYEDWLYMSLYPATVRAGSGLNAVTRAIDIARFMGFGKITVLGADCALRIKSRPPAGTEFGSPEHLAWLKTDTVMHADGGSAVASDASPLTLGAEIDSGTPDDTIRPGMGRHWETKIDLLVSAIWLKKMEEAYHELTIVGDTLTAALRGKTNEYLSRLPSFVDEHDNPVEIEVS